MSRRRTITLNHNGTTYYGQVAKIKSTTFALDDSFITASLNVEGDGWGTSAGGLVLDQPVHDDGGKFIERRPTAFGLDFIKHLVITVGASKWEQLPGREVIVLYDTEHPWGRIAVGIAHISDESKVLIFTEHAEKWKAELEEAVR